MPQKCAGIRIDPPPSLPVARGHRDAATAAAAPPLDPPGVQSGFQGLAPSPPSRFWQVPTMANSGTLVLPRMTAPAFRTRSTTAASRSGTRSLNTSEPAVVRIPRVIWLSLIETGNPCSGPSASPRAIAFSAALALSIASSGVSARNAFSRRSSRSMRPRKHSVSSTGETCFVEISARRSVAEANASASSSTRDSFPCS